MNQVYIAHSGRSKLDGAPKGSGRYPLGSGKRPNQHRSDAQKRTTKIANRQRAKSTMEYWLTGDNFHTNRARYYRTQKVQDDLASRKDTKDALIEYDKAWDKYYKRLDKVTRNGDIPIDHVSDSKLDALADDLVKANSDYITALSGYSYEDAQKSPLAKSGRKAISEIVHNNVDSYNKRQDLLKIYNS